MHQAIDASLLFAASKAKQKKTKRNAHRFFLGGDCFFSNESVLVPSPNTGHQEKTAVAALVHSAVVVKSPSPDAQATPNKGGKKTARRNTKRQAVTFLIGIHNFPGFALLIILCSAHALHHQCLKVLLDRRHTRACGQERMCWLWRGLTQAGPGRQACAKLST